MKKYKIRVTETLVKVVEIEAPDLAEAIWKAMSQYDEEKIVLSGDDFLDVDFNREGEDDDSDDFTHEG